VLAQLKGSSLAVSYKIDDSNEWSTPVSYPLGVNTVFKFGDVSEPYLQPGPHKISFRFQDDTNRVTEDVFHYTINGAPVLELQNTEPLSFKGIPTSSVVLPISVSDRDGDPVKVFYRFQGDDVWSHVPTVNGVYVLPASAFSDRLDNGKGSIEIFGWDGMEKSGNPLEIGYSIEKGGIVQPEGDEEPVVEEAVVDEELPAALFVAIGVAGVAIIALILGIILLVRRNKTEIGIS
jgi:hypothetical protein